MGLGVVFAVGLAVGWAVGIRDGAPVGSRDAGRASDDTCAAVAKVTVGVGSGPALVGAGGEVDGAVVVATCTVNASLRSETCNGAVPAVVSTVGGMVCLHIAGHRLLIGSLRVKQKRHAAHSPTRLQ